MNDIPALIFAEDAKVDITHFYIKQTATNEDNFK